MNSAFDRQRNEEDNAFGQEDATLPNVAIDLTTIGPIRLLSGNDLNDSIDSIKINYNGIKLALKIVSFIVYIYIKIKRFYVCLFIC